jgi:hypothetical protein
MSAGVTLLYNAVSLPTVLTEFLTIFIIIFVYYITIQRVKNKYDDEFG